MPFKVELHRDVAWFLRHGCDRDALPEFHARIGEIMNDPIGASEPAIDAKVSRYILRCFRFGRYIALFEWNPAKEKVIVRVCRPFNETG